MSKSVKIKYDGPTWGKVKPEIKEKFAKAGITECELDEETRKLLKTTCTSPVGLTFAHSLRRAKITEKEQMEEVALICQDEHSQLDKDPANAYRVVRKIIANRVVPVESIYDGTKNTGGLASVFEHNAYKAAHAKERYRNKPQGKRVLPRSNGGQDDGLR